MVHRRGIARVWVVAALVASALVLGHEADVDAPEIIGAQVPTRRLIDDRGLREILATFGTALKVGREGPGLLRPGGHQVITIGPG